MTVAPKAIAIDAMGGDFGPEVTVAAACAALKRHPHIHIFLVGDQAQLSSTLANCADAADMADRLHIQHADEVIEMHEDPLRAFKTKKNASMRLCVELVKSHEAQACVSAGNTGALLAIANFLLGRLPGVSRPGLITAMPTHIKDQPVHVIDLGANIDSQPEYLRDFAVMGSVKIAATQDGDPQPKVGLLSNGSEDIKGNQLVKATAALLEKTDSINYTGHIEADQILSGQVDLVVCDGFIGNIALKSIEGTAHFLKNHLKKALMKSAFTRCAGLLIKPVLKEMLAEVNPHRFNGASLLGVQGIVIKSHGSADIEGFGQAIHEAVLEMEHNVPEMLSHQLQQDASTDPS